MIRVAVDGRRLQDQPLTGVGRWLSGVLPHLSGAAEITVLTDRRRPHLAAHQPADQPTHQPTQATYQPIDLATAAALPVPGPVPETVWLQASVPAWLARHPGTVFHGTFNAIPVATRHPCVVSIYDLAWRDHPEDMSKAKALAFAAQARWAARHAAVILTVSDYTRQRLVDAYGLSDDRVVVTPVAVPAGFGVAASGAGNEWRSLHEVTGRYVIAVGGAARRGLPIAVEAWRQVTRRMAEPRQLVVVGPETPPPEPGVTAAGRVDDRTWASLLAGADAFCYPTRYEGFGLPALEAMASGTPVVAARVSALPEVLGDAAEWADGTGVDQIAAALHRVLADERRADDLRRRGLARAAARPSWAEAAGYVLDAYRRAAP